jgi:tRNA pseudouridine38-40 synthase
MKNIKLIIEYDGTNYSGWQTQKNAISVQGKLEDAIKTITGENIQLVGSGRTDGGVHALGQVANFHTNSTIPNDKFSCILNNALPDDIKIIHSEEVGLDFHSRFDAISKRYRYIIYNGKMPSPIYRNLSYHFKYDLDIDKMIRASKYLVGTHNFACFKGRKSVVKSTIRTIYYVDIRRKGDFIEFVFEGNSFLRYMVRIIIGTLVKIGSGERDVSDMKKIIDSKNRNNAGPTAPPQGLFLEKVFYPNDLT